MLDRKIDIIYEDDNIIAVDKPPSIPVHEAGNYKFNTLIGILDKEYGYKNLKNVHRLDR